MLNLFTKVRGDGNRQWKVTTGPTTEPITLAEVKTYARIDGSSEDTILESFIKSVRIATELYLGRALITQTLTMAMDYWPSWAIKLPRPPLISITEVRTLGEDGTKTTYASSNYYIDILSEPGELILIRGASAPLNDGRDHGGYEIVWVAGYGGASSVPNSIKEAMKFWVGMIYENRVPIAEAPVYAKMIMQSERIIPI